MSAGDDPLVSVVIPCRNEQRFIGPCLASILEGDWPLDRLEVLVADGLSEDGTRETVAEHARRYPQVRLIDNPARTTPYALNEGIRASRGAFIAILSAHSKCGPRYLSQCYARSASTGADNVGGVWRIVPRRSTAIGRAIALALSHPFGAGNAYYRTGVSAPREADTVAFGFYRREVFDRIGAFNEHLVRGQDMELNLRLARAGGRIILDPAISLDYYARSGLAEFWRHNFADGYWVTYAHRFARLPVSWRHLVPLAFVTALAAALVLAAVTPLAVPLVALVALPYIVVSLAVASSLALRERDVRLLPALLVVFGVRHVAYGIGSLAGIAALAARRTSPRPSPR